MAPGTRLPSIRALANQLVVNPLTVRQALGVLANNELVIAQPGRGTFVKSPERRTAHVALLIPCIGDALASQISDGVRHVVSSDGGRVSIFDAHDDPDTLAEHLGNLERYGVDGAVVRPLTGSSVIRAVLNLIMADYPLVLVDRYFSDVSSWNVVSDNFGGGRLAAQTLIDAGCRRVAFIGRLNCNATQARLDGYAEALAEHGLVFQRGLVREVTDGEAQARAHVETLLASDPRPDGIFFGADVFAMYGLQVIRAAGLRVPEDVQVVGFDDVPAARLMEPELTTIRQDGVEMGQHAARLLQERIVAPARSPARTEVVPVVPVIRATTRPIGAATDSQALRRCVELRAANERIRRLPLGAAGT